MNANAGQAANWDNIYKCNPEKCIAWEWETTYKHYDKLPPKPIGKSTTDGYCKRIGK